MEILMKNRTRTVLLLIGTVFFNVAFWHERLALNLFIFNLMIIVFALILFPEGMKSRAAMFSVAGSILTSCAVLVINSLISKVAAFSSMIAMIGLVQHTSLRSVWHGAKTSFINYFRIPDFIKNFKAKRSRSFSFKFGRTFKLSLLPIVILAVFFFIFKMANPVFSRFADTFFSSIGDFFTHFFQYFSIWRVYFFLLGLSIVNWAIYKGVRTYFVKREADKSESIFRNRDRRRTMINNGPTKEIHPYRFKFIPTLALKNENLMAAITMGLVCVLLFIVNTIDIIYVWFGFEYDAAEDLSARVHEGTYLLILSIVLSMIIMLWYFRKNLNFYKSNGLIKKLSYVWLAQNVILVFSVVLRNIYYINHQGITHKRIGVFIFLLLTIVGLVTLFLKIRNRKSTFFLMLKNSWAVYVVLILMALVNWDTLIVNYNVKHPNQSQIDYAYLLTLSDDAVIQLYDSGALQDDSRFQNKPNYLTEKEKKSGFYEHGSYHQRMLDKLNYRMDKIKEQIYTNESKHTFFSWNYRDQKIRRYVSDQIMTDAQEQEANAR